jgi:hypothetical protein
MTITLGAAAAYAHLALARALIPAEYDSVLGALVVALVCSAAYAVRVRKMARPWHFGEWRANFARCTIAAAFSTLGVYAVRLVPVSSALVSPATLALPFALITAFVLRSARDFVSYKSSVISTTRGTKAWRLVQWRHSLLRAQRRLALVVLACACFAACYSAATPSVLSIVALALGGACHALADATIENMVAARGAPDDGALACCVSLALLGASAAANVVLAPHFVVRRLVPPAPVAGTLLVSLLVAAAPVAHACVVALVGSVVPAMFVRATLTCALLALVPAAMAPAPATAMLFYACGCALLTYAAYAYYAAPSVMFGHDGVEKSVVAEFIDPAHQNNGAAAAQHDGVGNNNNNNHNIDAMRNVRPTVLDLLQTTKLDRQRIKKLSTEQNMTPSEWVMARAAATLDSVAVSRWRVHAERLVAWLARDPDIAPLAKTVYLCDDASGAVPPPGDRHHEVRVGHIIGALLALPPPA